MSTRSLTSVAAFPWVRLVACLAAGAMAVPAGELIAHYVTGWEAASENYFVAELAVSAAIFGPLAWHARRTWLAPLALVVGTACTMLVTHPGFAAAALLNVGAVAVAVLGGLAASSAGPR